eukprot:10005312-Lingulodinium_polyedra.AAC.1
MHCIAAVARVSRCPHFMRRPPRGRRVKCANREMRGAAAMECVSECMSDQLSPKAVQACA